MRRRPAIRAFPAHLDLCYKNARTRQTMETETGSSA
jgi:hypothetical protein